MKKALLFALAFILLAWCSALAVSPASTGAATPAATVYAGAACIPQPMPSVSSETTPTKTVATPIPTPLPLYTDTPIKNEPSSLSALPPLVGNEALPGLDIGMVAVAQGNIVYYTSSSYTIDNPECYSICSLDTKTHKTKTLRKTKTAISQIFLDEKGNLYYVCYNPDYDDPALSISFLYEYGEQQDKLLIKHIDRVERVDSDNIYFSAVACASDTGEQDECSLQIMKYCLTDGLISRIASFSYISDSMSAKAIPLMYLNFEGDMDTQAYVLDLTNSSLFRVLDLDEHFVLSDDGENLVAYKSSVNKTDFTIYNFRKLDKKTVTVPKKINNLSNALVTDERLCVFDNNAAEENPCPTKSNLYVIDIASGILVSEKTMDYISDACFYHGKWFFYTFVVVENGDIDTATKQKLQVFDPDTGKLKAIAGFGCWEMADDNYRTFEVCGGYAWMVQVAGCEGADYIYWKRIKVS